MRREATDARTPERERLDRLVRQLVDRVWKVYDKDYREKCARDEPDSTLGLVSRIQQAIAAQPTPATDARASDGPKFARSHQPKAHWLSRPSVEGAALDVKAFRANLHATFNGGHHEQPALRAFHHGMDTVCNVLEDWQKGGTGSGTIALRQARPEGKG